MNTESVYNICGDPMLPHQQRVVAEKVGLDERLNSLRAFFEPYCGVFESLPTEEKQRLIEQEEYMAGYSDVLARRIAAFTK